MNYRLLSSTVFALGLLTAPFAHAEKDTLISAGNIPDIETFMQIGFAGSPQMVQDESALLFTSNASGVSQIYRLELRNRWPYQLTVFPEGVDFYSLSPRGDYLIAGVDLGGNENAQLWLVDAKTGQSEALTASEDVRHGSAAWTNDGQSIVFRSNEENGTDFYIYKMDLKTRTKKRLVEMAGWNTPGDISNDDRWMIFAHWDSNANNDLYLVDLNNGRTTHITPHEGEAVYVGAQFAEDNQSVYLATNNNEDGLTRLAELNLGSKKVNYVDPENPWEILSVGISPDRSKLAWTTNEDGYARMKIKDLKSGRSIPAPPTNGQVGGFMFVGESSIVFSFSSATSTSDIWQWDWQRPVLEKLTHSTYAGVDPALFAEPELVRYKSFDGLEVPAFLYLPSDYQAGKPIPFVVHMHGGPESQFRPGFIRHFQYLMLNGYGILAPNVRGSTGYGKAYMDMDNYKKRLDSVKDMRAGVDFLLEEGYTAEGMVAVKGGSYGGYMTMAGITEYPSLFSAAINSVGITNFRTFLENTESYRRALREAEYGPLSDPEFLESVSPLNKAHLIETPLLVVHGENDPRVPVGEARQIATAIEEKGGVVETLIFADEGHGVSKRKNSLILYRKMVEFLDQQLKPKADSGTEE